MNPYRGDSFAYVRPLKDVRTATGKGRLPVVGACPCTIISSTTCCIKFKLPFKYSSSTSLPHKVTDRATASVHLYLPPWRMKQLKGGHRIPGIVSGVLCATCLLPPLAPPLKTQRTGAAFSPRKN